LPDIPEERQFAVGLELRDAQAVGAAGRYRFLEGVAVPYDVWADIGPFVEQHASGSFERSTRGAGKNLPLLLFHDNRKWPVGHAEKWSHDAGGLAGLWRLNDTDDAQTAAQLAEAGDLRGMSIGFQPNKSKWDPRSADDWNPDLGPEHKDRVTRLESRLLEVSLTPTPAFPDAQVACVRTAFTRDGRREIDAWFEIRAGLAARG
jgi:HK97 family phage prohead protease